MRDPISPGLPAPPHRSGFRLTGYFSLACLVGVVTVTLVLTLVYRHHALAAVVRHEESANVNLARALANAALPGYNALAGESLPLDPAALRAHPATAHLRERLRGLTRALRVAKVKVYNADGLAVYSTDEAQIGENKAANAGFRAAMAGQVTSQLTHRDRFDAIEGVLNDRDLVSTYVPTRSHAGAPIDGVFEIYVDVTSELASTREGSWGAVGAVLACLGALYTLLLVLIRRADRLLKAHDAERDDHESRIRHQAYHDPLTGLPNRAAFITALAHTVDRATSAGPRGALLFIDLNRFKQVNDQLGHAVGDALLCAIATRLRACLRSSDTLYRLGGDEFTVLMAGEARPEDAASLAQRLIERTTQPVCALEHMVACSISIGIALLPDDGPSAELLMQHADTAMYAAKAQGGGAFRFFAESMLGQPIRSMKAAAPAAPSSALEPV